MTFLDTLRNRHFFLLDVFFLSLTPILALLLGADGLSRAFSYWIPLIWYTVLSVLAKEIIFLAFGLYRRYWRYASIEELLLILKAVGSAALLLLILFFLAFTPPLPRSLPFIDALLTVAVVAGPRFAVRLWYRQQKDHIGATKRVLIYGAGDAGQLLAREMQQNPALGYDLVGFLDDDPQKQGLRLRGIPILGGRDAIPEIVREYRVQEIIIAMPSAPGRVIRQIIDVCKGTGVETRILPGFADMLNGDVSVRRLRQIKIEDLLRRDPVQTDIRAVQHLIRGKRVLITGAGGSIGAELCRQVWQFGPAQLILLGHGENSVFNIYHELRGRGPGVDAVNGRPTHLIPVIADIRFAERIQHIFEEYLPEIVFHAAAHKHVPLMEMNPSEAVTNNVVGTQNVLHASLKVGVQRFVMISTDKAVNPTSVMGATKRVAEYLVLKAARESGKPYVAVRFGNVLGSRGSVVLTFQRQIAAGGPVTVTHPEMRRYFMTIPEAVQLVLQAAVLGRGGEIFVLDMGEPIKIVDLARDLIELSGLQVGEDIEIVFTGMRPGEKLFEELFVPGEHYERTAHEKIFIAANASTFVPPDLEATCAHLVKAAYSDDASAILNSLKQLIPEFQPPSSEKPV